MDEKQKFMEEEGVNYKSLRIYLRDGKTVLKCKINIKKKISLIAFLNEMSIFTRQIKVTSCQRGGTEQEFETVSISSIMYIEEIENEKIEIPEGFTSHNVQVFMTGKMLNYGKVYYCTDSFRRLSDYLESVGAFFPFFMEEKLIYINNSPWGPLESIRHK